MANLHLQLVSPQRQLLDEEVSSLSCQTTEGQITILPGHTTLVGTLKPGPLSYTLVSGKKSTIHVAGGFVEVKSGGKVIILADAAEHLEEIDEKRASEAMERARELIRQSNISDEEYALAAASLERSMSRLRIKRKHAHSRTSPITSEGVRRD